MRLKYPVYIKVIRIPCTGKLDIIHILRAFEKGADGVYAVGCLEGGCHFNNGNLRARKRVQQAQKILDSIGVGGQRVAMWIFVVVLIVKTAQNVSVLIGGAAVIISADGIPLGTYSLEATQTVVSLWAFLGFIRLLICFLCFLILFQYRSLIPFMFVLLATKQD